MDVKSMIRAARGRNRNMTDFCTEINKDYTISIASLYRIANGDIKNDVADELLHAIIKHKAGDCDLTFNELKAAYDKLVHERNQTNVDIRKEYDHLEEITKNAIYDVAIKSGAKVQKYSSPDNNDWSRVLSRFNMALQLEKDNCIQKAFFKISVNAKRQYIDVIDQYIGMLMRTNTSSNEIYYLFFVDNESQEDKKSLRDSDHQRITELFKQANLPMNLYIVHLSIFENDSYFMTEVRLGPDEGILSFESDI